MLTEYEIDAGMRRTGRTRSAQFLSTMRYLAVPPSKRTPAPWVEACLQPAQHDQKDSR